MKAVLQRVLWARVIVAGRCVGNIDKGMVILLGVRQGDCVSDVAPFAEKIANLRIFSDAEGKMNRSLVDVEGEALVVSQFTLYGDCRKGRRPGFSAAAGSASAEPVYRQFVERMQDLGVSVATGIFAADMQVELANDGPVTLIVDSDS
ncbi:MAG: D-tyrosyl-tRNA(Tyr) deacylase [Deltaproteobacteria bacterium]|nr:MAG: D-tyrosyl-tRNA(Tyr) deacylase [Deltaproteobacteria bacterium]